MVKLNNVRRFSLTRLIHPTTIGLLFIYTALRAISWWTQDFPFIQAVIVIIITFGFGVAYFTRRELAWTLLATELALGGAGNFLEFAHLSLRTILLGTFLALSLFFAWYKKNPLNIKRELWLFSSLILVTIGWAVTQGFWLHNAFTAIVADTIPFLYLFLAIPLHNLQLTPTERNYLVRLGIAWVIGTSLFSLLVFVLYRSGLFTIHDLWYQWLRDVAGAKITFLTPWFYRVVFPEQLLVVPAALICLSMLMRRDVPHWKWWWLYGLTTLSLALNFSRGYFLGLIIGTLVLWWQHNSRHWLTISSRAAATFLLVFLATCLISSFGTQTGLPLLTGRMASIGAPTVETSSATRLLLLPVIKAKIAAHPLAGNGLGSTVTFYDPYLERSVTTASYDWGYLELWSELGIGASLYLGLWLAAALLLAQKIHRGVVDSDIGIGVLAGLVALLVIGLTTPALFHVFGTVYLSITLAILVQPVNRLRTLTTVVANFFRHLS